MFLLDIEKAFDTVWHVGLLHKLLLLESLPVPLVKLIASYLSCRTFAVHIGSEKSNGYTVPAGVPQGSVLGPILFVLYVNDIPRQPHTQLACFADDTASFCSESDTDLIIARLQLSMDLLQAYFTKWKLKLNDNKTEAIMFTKKRTSPSKTLTINGFSIPWLDKVKYLGVTFDTKLNWTAHLEILRMKGITALNALSPVLNRKTKLSPSTKLRIYSTLVRPCITYAAPVWSGTCKTNVEKLQAVQNKALKIAYCTPFYTNLHILHKSINYPRLPEYIIKLAHKFYFLTNKDHKNSLVSKIDTKHYNSIPYLSLYRQV